MDVHKDTLQGLNEVLAYVKGDKSQARSMTVDVPNDEADEAQLFYQKFNRLSAPCKQKVVMYVDELLGA
jgi:hypothetical protein